MDGTDKEPNAVDIHRTHYKLFLAWSQSSLTKEFGYQSFDTNKLCLWI